MLSIIEIPRRSEDGRKPWSPGEPFRRWVWRCSRDRPRNDRQGRRQAPPGVI